MERQPLELEIPAHLENYGPTHSAARPRQRREHITANERTAMKALLALLAGLYLVGLLAISGVPGLKVVAIPLALASLALEVILLANLSAAGVSERLFFFEAAPARPAPSKTRHALIILAILLVFAALFLLVIPVGSRSSVPIIHLAWFVFLLGWRALVEERSPGPPQPVAKYAPQAPSKPAYTPRPIPPLHIAFYIVLGLVVFAAGTALYSSLPAVTWSPPSELGSFVTQIGDTLRGLEALSIPADTKDLLILPRWLATSIVVAVAIAVPLRAFRKLEVTPYEGPPTTTPGNPNDASQPPNRTMVSLAAAGLVFGIAMFLIAVR